MGEVSGYIQARALLVRIPEEGQGEGMHQVQSGLGFEANGEVWGELDSGGEDPQHFDRLPTQPCASRLEQTCTWRGCGSFASLSCEACFPLCPGGPQVAVSDWGGLTLTPPAPRSQSGSWPWSQSWAGHFHLSLSLRLAWPATALSPAVRAAWM